MPGSTPATSQLDWLISTTAMIVLSWSKVTRDLLKSLGWGIRALHQLGTATMVPSPRRLTIPSPRWREMYSNPRSPVAGRGQAARNQIFRRIIGAEEYVRRNKAADRLVRRAPDQPSRNLPPPPFLFRHRRAHRGAWHGADDLRWQRS